MASPAKSTWLLAFLKATAVTDAVVAPSARHVVPPSVVMDAPAAAPATTATSCEAVDVPSTLRSAVLGDRIRVHPTPPSPERNTASALTAYTWELDPP